MSGHTPFSELTKHFSAEHLANIQEEANRLLAEMTPQEQGEKHTAPQGGTAMNYNQYISMDPDILRGKPCIAGTRISVELILELLSLGYSFSDILEDYPQLTQEQLSAVLDRHLDTSYSTQQT